MHLVNILRIITFSFLVGHSILKISDFNSFRFFWDTLYICKKKWIIFCYVQYMYIWLLPDEPIWKIDNQRMRRFWIIMLNCMLMTWLARTRLEFWENKMIRMFHCLFIVLKISLFSMPSSHDPVIRMFHCLFIVLKISLFSMPSSHDPVIRMNGITEGAIRS
jgi:hypothetical protein